jgi:hypothetical protein
VNRVDRLLRKTYRFTNIAGILPALLCRNEEHLRVPDHGTTNGGVFDDVVLLHDRQNVTTKLSHLTIILLDHFDSPRDIQRSSVTV